jgi:superfamily II DNA/RNA helicase
MPLSNLRSSISTPTGFDRFGLHSTLLRGIRSAGFVSPRPIQLATIPAALQRRDVLGLAQTGTGKTAAFALPVLHHLLDAPGKGPRVLVLAPTRELASQIAEETRLLSKYTQLKTITVYGGVSTFQQVSTLRQGPEIVVGCPGRVLDLLQQGALHAGRIETLVLDEADHMFDLGFLRDVRKIIRALPKRRQNLLFSATMPTEVRGLADELLAKPLVVDLAGSAPVETIDHALYPVAEAHKRALLEAVLAQEDCVSAIVFTRTKHRTRRLADQLQKAGHRAVGLQGGMSQNARDRAMSGFRARQYDVLVATDIAARGIDVTGVSHVINFDVPSTPEGYTHRIGRTGRAEREGVACTFVTTEDAAWVRATERMIGAPIRRRRVEGFVPPAAEVASTRPASRNRPVAAPAMARPSAAPSRPPGRRSRLWGRKRRCAAQGAVSA